jgi:ferredoxin-NADP reductase
VPYNFGFIANSPELALLVGNLLAFMVGQRGGLKLRFTGSRALTPSTTEFVFKPSRPVRFVPGQYMELDLPHAKSDGKGRRRVFSVTSAPGSGMVKFGVRTAEPVSAAKKVLLSLQPGDQVTATSVGGDFVLPRDRSRPVLLVAAGIGITPYLAQLASGAADERDTTLLLLARNAEEIAYAEELRSSAARIVVRLADGSAAPLFFSNAATDGSGDSPGPGARLDAASLKALVPDIAEREVYISGSPASVASLRRAARKAGARRVHVDSFAGY